MMEDAGQIDSLVARRLRAARAALGLTLDDLARRSGVSRAMISRIERGEASPTAALLGRLTGPLGLTMSALFAEDRAAPSPLARAADRPVWTDPDSGYRRRNVSPGTSPIDLVDVTMPAGARVAYDHPVPLPLDQLVWVIEGELSLEAGGTPHRLGPGDCLHMRLDRPIVFRNASRRPVRYAVAVAAGMRHPEGLVG